MQPRALIRISLAAGVLAAAGAAGCSIAQTDDAASSPDAIVSTGDTSALLKSTLILAGGCTAAKVGPRHLLVSAGCVTGKDAFTAGKILTFTSAAAGKTLVAADPPADPAAAPADPDAAPADPPAAPADPAADDAGAPPDDAAVAAPVKDASSTSRDVTIADVKIHPSYVTKCTADACGPNRLAASDAADIAIIVLAADLDTVPSIPVDLDPVGQADALLVVTSGCSNLDTLPSAAPKTVKSSAVPATSVSHIGSAYEKSPTLVSRLASSYVVTAGAGWRATDTHLCKADLGSPIFRGGSASVAGVTANYSTYANAKFPVTIHHTRVDAMSRFKIGDWLAGLGVETMHSCSESAAGCAKHSYDGGAPSGAVTGATGDGTTSPGDGGSGDPIAPDGGAADDDAGSGDTAPMDPHADQLPTEDPSAGDDPGSEPDYADAAAPKKKKKAASGCSAAPGGPAPTGEMFLVFGVALGAAVIRRRRK
jgi:MYXO-CTERM domain-containing protein